MTAGSSAFLRLFLPWVDEHDRSEAVKVTLSALDQDSDPVGNTIEDADFWSYEWIRPQNVECVDSV